MARLKSKHKRFVVRRLAVFDRPSEVREALRERHEVEADLSQLAHYDPTNQKGQGLAEDLKTLFWDTREDFLEEQKGIALSYKSVRLRELEKQYYRLKDSLEDLPSQNVLGRADVLEEMRDVLEQMAKETGGKYTSTQMLELMGEGGGPIETEEQGGVAFFVPEEEDEEALRSSDAEPDEEPDE